MFSLQYCCIYLNAGISIDHVHELARTNEWAYDKELNLYTPKVKLEEQDNNRGTDSLEKLTTYIAMLEREINC